MKLFVRMGLIVLLAVGVAGAKTPAGSADSRAGYHDGCSSARGHYTRSRYKYAHSKSYHRAWLRGKRKCAHRPKARHHRLKRHHARRHHTHTRRHVAPCNTQVPWEAFRRGWDHGYRSARGHFFVDRRGCAAYRQGWVSGYRACHCPDRQKPDSYASGYAQGCSSTAHLKIRDNLYYKRSRSYRHGWIQGYRDCRGIYQ